MRPDESYQKLTLVLAEMVDTKIRYFHERPGVANQAAKATSEKNHRNFLLAKLEKGCTILHCKLSRVREIPAA